MTSQNRTARTYERQPAVTAEGTTRPTGEERTARIFARHAYAATIAAAHELAERDPQAWNELESPIILADDAAYAAAEQILSYGQAGHHDHDAVIRAAQAATYEAHRLDPTLVERTGYPDAYGDEEIAAHTAAAQAHGIYTGPVDEQAAQRELEREAEADAELIYQAAMLKGRTYNEATAETRAALEAKGIDAQIASSIAGTIEQTWREQTA